MIPLFFHFFKNKKISIALSIHIYIYITSLVIIHKKCFAPHVLTGKAIFD